eukprot:TRINITY_DN6461_c0_g1_i1.p1 TRINITY_DN6461_c0_g1~~TRINITY_DN6461_c0_g1_i1.p1  ORF type:complete len:241 (+),score=48.14 TRINITY_DN6461_c0_g1_i1:431-1153(+)
MAGSVICLLKRLYDGGIRGSSENGSAYLKIRDDSGIGQGFSSSFEQCRDFSAWVSKFRDDSEKKRVVVVLDESREAKVALHWTFSHVVNDGDTVILLHLCDCEGSSRLPEKFKLIAIGESTAFSSSANSYGWDGDKPLQGFCNSPQVLIMVEHITLRGEKSKANVIINQARRLGADILVIGQKKPSMLHRIFPKFKRKDEMAQVIINKADCLAVGIRKQKKGMGGYIINSRWQKNFWLLA